MPLRHASPYDTLQQCHVFEDRPATPAGELLAQVRQRWRRVGIEKEAVEAEQGLLGSRLLTGC